MMRRRSYWIFSAALAIVWIVLLVVNGIDKGFSSSEWDNVALVACGFWIGWVACTIARFVYPPAQRWQQSGGGTATPPAPTG